MSIYIMADHLWCKHKCKYWALMNVSKNRWTMTWKRKYTKLEMISANDCHPNRDLRRFIIFKFPINLYKSNYNAHPLFGRVTIFKLLHSWIHEWHNQSVWCDQMLVDSLHRLERNAYANVLHASPTLFSNPNYIKIVSIVMANRSELFVFFFFSFWTYVSIVFEIIAGSVHTKQTNYTFSNQVTCN